MKPRQPLPRISKKRLAANGGRYPASSISKRSSIRKKPRKKSGTLRIYGGKKRIEFVASLPCAACGIEGYTDQAHVAPPSEKGTGYKAGYIWIAPLCHAPRFRWWNGSLGKLGCHQLFDEHREAFNGLYPDFNPEKAAAETESRWLAFSDSHRTGMQE